MKIKMKKIIIGSDHAAFKLKEEVKIFLEKSGKEVEDLGTHSEDTVDYPKIAEKVAKKVAHTFQGHKMFIAPSVAQKTAPAFCCRKCRSRF